LDDEPAGHAAKVPLTRVPGSLLGVLDDAGTRLLLQKLGGPLAVSRSEQHLDEVLAQSLGQRTVHPAAQHDDSAEGAQRVAGEGSLVGVLERLGDGATTGVVVLDDGGGGKLE